MTFTQVTIRCVCGAWIGEHLCHMRAKPLDPTYTESQIYEALEYALGGAVFEGVWDDMETKLKEVKE